MKTLTPVLAQIVSRSALPSLHKSLARIALVLLIPVAAIATTYDANSLTIAASSGDSVTTLSVAGASGGNIRVFNSNAVSDYIIFSVSVPATGEYALSVRFYNNPNRGTVRLSVDDVEQGALHDGYHSSGNFVIGDYGKLLLSAGTRQIKFTVTGHNASSSSYRIGLDTVTLDAAPGRTNITSFTTITDALNSGVPLYAPPGTYTLPVGFTPSANIDILGSMDSANPTVFNLSNPTFYPSNYSARFQGIRFFGAAGPGAKLFLANNTLVFDVPNLTVFDCVFDACSPILWGFSPSVAGQVIRRMEMRRFSIVGANRGLYAGGRVDDYDITDFNVSDVSRVGISIGPSGTGIDETIENYMQRGMVARGTISGTKILKSETTNNQLQLTGNNVVVEDIELLNMVLPSEYYTDPSLATSYWHDSEPFYTKVEYLTVKNLYVENDGAFQAMWGHKGASLYTKSPISPSGRDGVATDITFVNTGQRYAVGIWHQTHGNCVYKNVTMVNRTNDAVIVLDNSASGTLTIENWVDLELDPVVAAQFPGVKNKSLNNDPGAPAPVAVTLINSPTLTEYNPIP